VETSHGKHDPGSEERMIKRPRMHDSTRPDQTFPPYARVVFTAENAHPVDVQRPYFGVWPTKVECPSNTHHEHYAQDHPR
jgi:hypothetical protein